MTDWTIAQARRTYSVPHWSEGYVDVDEAGRVVVRPQGTEGPAMALPDIIETARREGLRIPLLLRFPEILANRLQRLQSAFATAVATVP